MSRFSIRRSLGAFWEAIREEPGRFRYAVWIKSAFLTSVIVLVYSFIRTISVIHRLHDLYCENRQRVSSNMDEFEVFLKASGWWNGTDSIDGTIVVKIYLMVDAVILDMKLAIYIGYSLGIVVGFWSLASVLIQHKRMSLSISEGLFVPHDEATSAEEQVESPWASFQKRYRVVGSCVFLAILSSTAVMQLHIIGILSSFLLALIINFSTSRVLFDLFGYYVLAFVLVRVADIVIKHSLTQSLVSPDGSRILHPRWFNFFILVLSMVRSFPD